MNVVSFRSIEGIESAFGDLTVVSEPKRRYSPAELRDRCAGAHALFVHSENTYSRDLFEATPDLQVIGKAGSGIDNIDLDGATEHGIAVVHTPGMNAVAVAEYTVGALISFQRRFPAVEAHLRDGGWRSPDWWGSELRGKTVGIVGLGAAGLETARRLRPFDVELVVADPYVDDERIDRIDGRRTDLDTLLGTADIVSLHVRLTPETDGLLGRDELETMDDDAILINTSRGRVVDRSALVDALAGGQIGGAILDVFDEEPPDEGDPLLSFDTVMATPHIAGATGETRYRMLKTTAENVRRALAGERVDESFVANPAVFADRD